MPDDHKQRFFRIIFPLSNTDWQTGYYLHNFPSSPKTWRSTHY